MAAMPGLDQSRCLDFGHHLMGHHEASPREARTTSCLEDRMAYRRDKVDRPEDGVENQPKGSEHCPDQSPWLAEREERIKDVWSLQDDWNI